jgi:hypothetical protein
MLVSMRKLFKLAGFAAVLLTAASALPGGASASGLEPNRDIILKQGSVLDLQILDQRQRQRLFHQQQQLDREIDRQPAVAPQRLEIPRMQQNCQLQAFGNKYLTTCR